ncbi:hypothetical protein CK203_092891 [Vitis vinifera]|uniref:Uncharacterized protein n=1 Tax=Vitis vinifera TaxID=29760 RepID=A0A438E2U1_VITVI|nr:hypothetical protein CK203_092891 [Vitis vinifera]
MSGMHSVPTRQTTPPILQPICLWPKLSNILHTNELARPFKVFDLLLDKNKIGSNFMEDGVNMTANSLYPGMIVTKLFRHSNIVTGSCNHMLCGIASTGEGGERPIFF